MIAACVYRVERVLPVAGRGISNHRLDNCHECCCLDQSPDPHPFRVDPPRLYDYESPA